MKHNPNRVMNIILAISVMFWTSLVLYFTALVIAG